MDHEKALEKNETEKETDSQLGTQAFVVQANPK